MRKFITYDGKYTTTNDAGLLKVWRYDIECIGEPWREEDLIGDGYVLSLIHRIEELEDELSKTKEDLYISKEVIKPAGQGDYCE